MGGLARKGLDWFELVLGLGAILVVVVGILGLIWAAGYLLLGAL